MSPYCDVKLHPVFLLQDGEVNGDVDSEEDEEDEDEEDDGSWPIGSFWCSVNEVFLFCFLFCFLKQHKNLMFGRLFADEESSPAKGEKRKRDPEDEDEEDDD